MRGKEGVGLRQRKNRNGSEYEGLGKTKSCHLLAGVGGISVAVHILSTPLPGYPARDRSLRTPLSCPTAVTRARAVLLFCLICIFLCCQVRNQEKKVRGGRFLKKMKNISKKKKVPISAFRRKVGAGCGSFGPEQMWYTKSSVSH